MADWPAVVRDPVTGEVQSEAPFLLSRRTGGLFHDFATGAPGVRIVGGEPPSPNFINSTSLSGANAQLVYADPSEVGLEGVPGWMKLTCSGAGSQKAIFSDLVLPDTPTPGGRMYVYFPLTIAQTRLHTIFTNGTAAGTSAIAVRLNTARTISILDANNNLKLTSGVALSADQPYRIEFEVEMDASGTMFRMWIFEDHNELALDYAETVTPFAAGTLGRSSEFGNCNGANLAGKWLYMTCIASGCSQRPGAYAGKAEQTFQVAGREEGLYRLEIGPNGDIIQRAARDFHIGDGGTEQYLIQEGDITGRWNGDGMALGAGIGTEKTALADLQGVDLHDISEEVKNRRHRHRGGGYDNLHDPPDVAFTRRELISSPEDVNYGYVGHKGTLAGDVFTVDPSDIQNAAVMGLPGGVWEFIMRRRGHGILISGVSYNISEILGPLTVKVKCSDPAPAADGSNLTWKLKIFPYPLASEQKGSPNGLTVGQPSRMLPMAYRPIAKGSNGVSTTAGSAVVDISALSAGNKAFWTAGRRVLINDDAPAMKNAPGRCHKILSVAGDGNSVTLNAVYPTAYTNVKWKLAASEDDGFPTETPNFLMTESHNAEADIVNWDTGMMTGCSNVIYTGILQDTLWTTAMPLPDFFHMSSDGSIEFLAGVGTVRALSLLAQSEFGYQSGQGVGGQVTQLTSKSTGVTINKATGKITMNNAALASGAFVSFVVTCDDIKSINDVIDVIVIGPVAAAGRYRAWAEMPFPNSVQQFTIIVQNIDSVSRSDAIQLQYLIKRGAQG